MQKAALVGTGLGFLTAIVALALGATWWWLPFILSLGAVITRAGQYGYMRYKQRIAELQYEEPEPEEPNPTDLQIAFTEDGDDQNALQMGFRMDPKKFGEYGKFFDVVKFLEEQQKIHLLEKAQELYREQVSKKVDPQAAAENVIRILSLMGSSAMKQTYLPPPPPSPKKAKVKRKVVTSRIQGRNVKDHGLY